MSEVNNQFTVWNSQLELSTQELNAASLADPLDLATIEDALSGLEIDRIKV